MSGYRQAGNAVGSTAGGGIGLFGVLIVLGVLGLGPCAEDCGGNCGPTIADVMDEQRRKARADDVSK